MSVNDLLAFEPGAKEEFLNSRLGYTEVAGDPELRKSIEKLYTTMSADNIIVHVGAQEPIFNFMNVSLDKGDHIISQFPTYQSLYSVADNIGCEVSKWEIHHDGNNWYMDIDELESMIQANTKVICINNPNNPTGFIFTEEEMKKIAEIAKKYDIYILSDEVYKGLELDGIKRPWFSDLYVKAVSVGVMSKSYGLAGLRTGWIASRDEEMLGKMMKMKHYTTICSCSTGEFLSTVALKHSDAILDHNLEIIKENLKIAEDFFARFPNLFEYNRPVAGPVAFHKVNIDIPIKEFVDKVVDESGVLLLGADIYDYDGQYFRMGYGRKNFPESLKVFEAYLLKKGYENEYR
jgi:aspartate/methionine/tyrosine aminotransferase